MQNNIEQNNKEKKELTLDTLVYEYLELNIEEDVLKAKKKELKDKIVEKMGTDKEYISKDNIKASLVDKESIKYKDEGGLIKYLKENGYSKYVVEVVDTSLNKEIKSNITLNESVKSYVTKNISTALSVKNVD